MDRSRATLSVLIVVPLLVDETYQLGAIMRHALVLPAWERLTYLEPWVNSAYPATVVGSWIALAGWTLVAGTVAVTALNHRDV